MAWIRSEMWWGMFSKPVWKRTWLLTMFWWRGVAGMLSCGWLKGKGRGGDTAKKVTGGAVVGAIIGGVAGGGTGAAIGAGVGGAAGAGAEVLTRGRAVRVPSETLLEFRLDQPVTVTPTQR